MAIMTLKLERAEEDGLFYLTEGTSVDGYEVIDGKLYTENGLCAGEIINMNQLDGTMEIIIKINNWMLQADE